MITYKIQSGDTLTKIAQKYNTTVDAIANANGIKNKNLIYTGDTLQIPDGMYGDYQMGGTSIDVAGTNQEGTGAEKARKEIISWQTKRPEMGKDTYSDDIKALVSTLTGMDFTYDPKSDIVYKLVRDENMKNARLAMEDTLGKASALTGGYSNTYAQGAANQAYLGELTKTAEFIPELYRAAYDRFSDERDGLSDAIKLLSDLESEEFDKYTALMKQYLSEGEMLFDNYKWESEEEFNRFLDYAELMQKAAK